MHIYRRLMLHYLFHVVELLDVILPHNLCIFLLLYEKYCHIFHKYSLYFYDCMVSPLALVFLLALALLLVSVLTLALGLTFYILHMYTLNKSYIDSLLNLLLLMFASFPLYDYH